jgi:peroxiredoxin
MRADIVAGAVFPDYELTDHAGKRRKLSDLQGPDPMILVLSRGGFCPKDRRQAEGLVQLHHEMEVGYSRLVTISTAPASALIGPFYPIRDERFRRISTSPSTRTPSTIR